MNFVSAPILFGILGILVMIVAFIVIRAALKANSKHDTVGGNASSARTVDELAAPPAGAAPGATPGRMEDEPINNPLDYREDGSIRPGDPAYDFMMQVMKEGSAGIARQNPDGTWATEIKKDKP